jgi:2-oxoglutarate ferredoxin oxidoreductase subunit beta
MKNYNKFTTPIKCTWCPGCGNFGILESFKMAANKKGWDNTNTVLAAGIGCHGHIVNFLKLTSFEGLHGRPIPLGCGIKMANHRLNVFVFTGDGDCLGEGGNHFMHASRRNHNITVLIHDNAVYGLTVGQTSPRSPRNYKSKSTPQGNLEDPVNPLQLALVAGATFVARSYSGDIPQLTDLIIKANQHKGFSVIDILQPCVTFNKQYTHMFYQKNTYQIGKNYDPSNFEEAFKKAGEWGTKKIPVGIFYQVKKPSYEEQIPQIKKTPLVDIPLKKRDISDLLNTYQ